MTRYTNTSRHLVAVIATCWLCGSIAWADHKPGHNPGGGNGGGNGGGVIYFDFDGELYTMNDDGSDMTVVAGIPGGSVPSRQLHGPKRWFPFWPGQELLGLSDAGDVITLHNDPQLRPWSDIQWQVGDEGVSWTGIRRDGTGAVIEGGIYTMPVTFDGDGNIASAGPTELLVSLPLVVDGSGAVGPDIFWHDWSPDGTQLVYDTLSSEIVIADLSTGAFDTVVTDMWNPRWSPAGDKLMVRYQGRRGRDGVGIINVDGSDLKSVELDGALWWTEVGAWSPSGSHVAYAHRDRLLEDSYIARSTADGKGRRRLTDSSVADFLGPSLLGWREAPVVETAGFASVPEPSTLVLAFFCVTGAVGSRRRSRH